MFSRFLIMSRTHWYQALFIAILLYMFVHIIEEYGFAELVRKFDIRKAMFFLYLAFILCAAFLSRGTLTENPISKAFENFWPIEWEEKENILAFIPITFLYLHAYEAQRPICVSIKLAVAVSTFIEVSQLVSCLGSFQFSDILYNTVGGAIGGMAYLLVCWLIKSVMTLMKRNKPK